MRMPRVKLQEPPSQFKPAGASKFIGHDAVSLSSRAPLSKIVRLFLSVTDVISTSR